MKTQRSRLPEAHEVRALTQKLTALNSMGNQELANEYTRLFRKAPRSANREFLIRQVADAVQRQLEGADGGLSAAATHRRRELERRFPPEWERRVSNAGLFGREPPTRSRDAPVPGIAPTEVRDGERDPRLPPPGSVIGRVHEGRLHSVVVREATFEYEGASYRTLSAVARKITGRQWNGFRFFQLSSATESVKEQ
jgi:hypothetical protein